MSYDQMTLLFALLGVLAQIGVVLVVVDVVGDRSPGGRGRFGIAEALAPWGLWIAFAIALVATAGSLYLSEIAHLPPCRLCWFQRIAVYPLVPILGIAAWRRDLQVGAYVWALNGFGTLVSFWHVAVERWPSLESGACDPLNPCSIVWFRHFGYLTIPALAAVAQISVATFVWVGTRRVGATPVEAQTPEEAVA